MIIIIGILIGIIICIMKRIIICILSLQYA